MSGRHKGAQEIAEPIAQRLPTGWGLARLKHLLASPLAYGTNEAADGDDQSLPRYIRITDIDEHGHLKESTYRSMPWSAARPYLLEDQDILLARSGSVGRSLMYRSEAGPACFAGYLIRARVDRRKLLPEFLAYYLNSHPYWEYVQGSSIQATIQNVSAEKYGNLPVPLPSLAEQARIAAHLDHETARIDELVREQEQLIDLLIEQRDRVVYQAVSKGIDPAVRLVDSGSRWFGHVPEHWNIVKLKRHWKVVDCKHTTAEFVSVGIPLASIREVQGFYVDLSRAQQTTEADYSGLIEGGRKPSRGDIIYSRNATVGEAAIVNTGEPFAMGQDVCLLKKLIPASSSEFLLYQLRSFAVRSQLQQRMVGATFKRINVEDIRDFEIAVPPPAEQHEIATFLARRTAALDELVANSRASVQLLHERRSALISAAVTGQLDLRDWQPPELEAVAEVA